MPFHITRPQTPPPDTNTFEAALTDALNETLLGFAAYISTMATQVKPDQLEQAIDWSWPATKFDAIALPLAQACNQPINNPVVVKATEDLFTYIDQRAVQYSKERSGALVTRISQQTRDTVRQETTRTVNGEQTVDQLARNLQTQVPALPQHAQAANNAADATYADTLTRAQAAGDPNARQTAQQAADATRDRLTRRYAKYRANMIARTETMAAENMGRLASIYDAKASGIAGPDVVKKWVITSVGTCDKCQPYAGKEAAYNGTFANGVAVPPLHPHCRCTIIPVRSTKKPPKPQETFETWIRAATPQQTARRLNMTWRGKVTLFGAAIVASPADDVLVLGLVPFLNTARRRRDKMADLWQQIMQTADEHHIPHPHMDRLPQRPLGPSQKPHIPHLSDEWVAVLTHPHLPKISQPGAALAAPMSRDFDIGAVPDLHITGGRPWTASEEIAAWESLFDQSMDEMDQTIEEVAEEVANILTKASTGGAYINHIPPQVAQQWQADTFPALQAKMLELIYNSDKKAAEKLLSDIMYLWSPLSRPPGTRYLPFLSPNEIHERISTQLKRLDRYSERNFGGLNTRINYAKRLIETEQPKPRIDKALQDISDWAQDAGLTITNAPHPRVAAVGFARQFQAPTLVLRREAFDEYKGQVVVAWQDFYPFRFDSEVRAGDLTHADARFEVFTEALARMLHQRDMVLVDSYDIPNLAEGRIYNMDNMLLLAKELADKERRDAVMQEMADQIHKAIFDAPTTGKMLEKVRADIALVNAELKKMDAEDIPLDFFPTRSAIETPADMVENLIHYHMALDEAMYSLDASGKKAAQRAMDNIDELAPILSNGWAATGDESDLRDLFIEKVVLKLIDTAVEGYEKAIRDGAINDTFYRGYQAISSYVDSIDIYDDWVNPDRMFWGLGMYGHGLYHASRWDESWGYSTSRGGQDARGHIRTIRLKLDAKLITSGQLDAAWRQAKLRGEISQDMDQGAYAMELGYDGVNKTRGHHVVVFNRGATVTRDATVPPESQWFPEPPKSVVMSDQFPTLPDKPEPLGEGWRDEAIEGALQFNEIDWGHADGYDLDNQLQIIVEQTQKLLAMTGDQRLAKEAHHLIAQYLADPASVDGYVMRVMSTFDTLNYDQQTRRMNTIIQQAWDQFKDDHPGQGWDEWWAANRDQFDQWVVVDRALLDSNAPILSGPSQPIHPPVAISSHNFNLASGSRKKAQELVFTVDGQEVAAEWKAEQFAWSLTQTLDSDTAYVSIRVRDLLDAGYRPVTDLLDEYARGFQIPVFARLKADASDLTKPLTLPASGLTNLPARQMMAAEPTIDGRHDQAAIVEAFKTALKEKYPNARYDVAALDTYRPGAEDGFDVVAAAMSEIAGITSGSRPLQSRMVEILATGGKAQTISADLWDSIEHWAAAADDVGSIGLAQMVDGLTATPAWRGRTPQQVAEWLGNVTTDTEPEDVLWRVLMYRIQNGDAPIADMFTRSGWDPTFGTITDLNRFRDFVEEAFTGKAAQDALAGIGNSADQAATQRWLSTIFAHVNDYLHERMNEAATRQQSRKTEWFMPIPPDAEGGVTAWRRYQNLISGGNFDPDVSREPDYFPHAYTSIDVARGHDRAARDIGPYATKHVDAAIAPVKIRLKPDAHVVTARELDDIYSHQKVTFEEQVRRSGADAVIAPNGDLIIINRSALLVEEVPVPELNLTHIDEWVQSKVDLLFEDSTHLSTTQARHVDFAAKGIVALRNEAKHEGADLTDIANQIEAQLDRINNLVDGRPWVLDDDGAVKILGPSGSDIMDLIGQLTTNPQYDEGYGNVIMEALGGRIGTPQNWGLETRGWDDWFNGMWAEYRIDLDHRIQGTPGDATRLFTELLGEDSPAGRYLSAYLYAETRIAETVADLRRKAITITFEDRANRAKWIYAMSRDDVLDEALHEDNTDLLDGTTYWVLSDTSADFDAPVLQTQYLGERSSTIQPIKDAATPESRIRMAYTDYADGKPATVVTAEDLLAHGYRPVVSDSGGYLNAPSYGTRWIWVKAPSIPTTVGKIPPSTDTAYGYLSSLGDLTGLVDSAINMQRFISNPEVREAVGIIVEHLTGHARPGRILPVIRHADTKQFTKSAKALQQVLDAGVRPAANLNTDPGTAFVTAMNAIRAAYRESDGKKADLWDDLQIEAPQNWDELTWLADHFELADQTVEVRALRSRLQTLTERRDDEQQKAAARIIGFGKGDEYKQVNSALVAAKIRRGDLKNIPLTSPIAAKDVKAAYKLTDKFMTDLHLQMPTREEALHAWKVDNFPTDTFGHPILPDGPIDIPDDAMLDLIRANIALERVEKIPNIYRFSSHLAIEEALRDLGDALIRGMPMSGRWEDVMPLWLDLAKAARRDGWRDDMLRDGPLNYSDLLIRHPNMSDHTWKAIVNGLGLQQVPSEVHQLAFEAAQEAIDHLPVAMQRAIIDRFPGGIEVIAAPRGFCATVDDRILLAVSSIRHPSMPNGDKVREGEAVAQALHELTHAVQFATAKTDAVGWHDLDGAFLLRRTNGGYDRYSLSRIFDAVDEWGAEDDFANIYIGKDQMMEALPMLLQGLLSKYGGYGFYTGGKRGDRLDADALRYAIGVIGGT